MFIIKIDDYAYIIPFVENENEIFLKTIYPSRKDRYNSRREKIKAIHYVRKNPNQKY